MLVESRNESTKRIWAISDQPFDRKCSEMAKWVEYSQLSASQRRSLDLLLTKVPECTIFFDILLQLNNRLLIVCRYQFSLVHQWEKNSMLLLVIHLISPDRIQCRNSNLHFIWYLEIGYQIGMCKIDRIFNHSKGTINIVIHTDDGSKKINTP